MKHSNSFSITLLTQLHIHIKIFNNTTHKALILVLPPNVEYQQCATTGHIQNFPMVTPTILCHVHTLKHIKIATHIMHDLTNTMRDGQKINSALHNWKMTTKLHSYEFRPEPIMPEFYFGNNR